LKTLLAAANWAGVFFSLWPPLSDGHAGFGRQGRCLTGRRPVASLQDAGFLAAACGQCGCRPVASPLRVYVSPVGGFGAMPADDVACPVWGY